MPTYYIVRKMRLLIIHLQTIQLIPQIKPMPQFVMDIFTNEVVTL